MYIKNDLGLVLNEINNCHYDTFIIAEDCILLIDYIYKEKK